MRMGARQRDATSGSAGVSWHCRYFHDALRKLTLWPFSLRACGRTLLLCGKETNARVDDEYTRTHTQDEQSCPRFGGPMDVRTRQVYVNGSGVPLDSRRPLAQSRPRL